MCPLRIILIFLSATLAAFFLLKNLKSPHNTNIHQKQQHHSPRHSLLTHKTTHFPTYKFRGVIKTGFWTCVDMASGRYLWRNLVSSSPSLKGST